MTDSQAYVAFNLTEKIGPSAVAKGVAKYGSVVAAWEAYPNKVSRTGGPVDWEAEFSRAERLGARIVTPADADYPALLRKTPGAPLALSVRGSLAALDKPTIALIGTRRASAYGYEMANRLAQGLAEAGWCVVSGLALGIDAQAHRGALRGKGATVGVIGSALDRFYPEENLDLAHEMIAAGGAVVSQFPFGRPPDQRTFPIRNHVVASLARGVVSVEAPFKSGTLITAGMAADLGRTVMAVPARVGDRLSSGNLQLIRDGAILVRDVDDILEALGAFASRSAQSSQSPQRVDPETPKYSAEEALMMLHVDQEGISLDELVRKTKLPVDKVHALALALRLKGFVQFLPGNRISLLTGSQHV